MLWPVSKKTIKKLFLRYKNSIKNKRYSINYIINVNLISKYNNVEKGEI